MIIGFAGKAHAGKDLAGQYLVKEYHYLHYYFAKPLKEACKYMFQLTDKQIANKEKAIEPWGISPRVMYQHIGTDIGRSLDPNIWIKNAQMFVDNSKGRTVVITDCRFSNEAYWIQNQGGIVIQIKRDSKPITEGKHASENGMKESDYDFTIHNDGTKEDLFNQVDKCMDIIKERVI